MNRAIRRVDAKGRECVGPRQTRMRYFDRCKRLTWPPDAAGLTGMPMPSTKAAARSIAAAALALSVLAGCDDSFSPISPTDLQFSVFGYLDASADTQWIRVMPIRELVPTQPDSFGAVVMVADVGTGQIVTLRDSVFRFTNYVNPEVGSEGIYLHNYWTTERIDPGASYRISISANGEEPSEAVVQVPEDFQVEVWLRQQSAAARDSDQLRLTGAKHVPFARATSWFRDQCGSYLSDQISFSVKPAVDGVHAINIRKATVVPRGCGGIFADRRLLWVVNSEVAWPAGAAYSPTNVGVPEGLSNISHSVGFVAGVMTKTLPYESCEIVGPAPLPSYCKLRYDAAAATIHGKVSEVRCGLGPFDTLQVQLSEVDANATGHRKLRNTLTNRSGQFEIGGLEPGVRYFLLARPPTRRDERGFIIQLYTQHTDTVVFTPGERRLYDIGLRRLDAC